MHFEGKHDIEASREALWTFLVDVRKVSRCIPDVRKVEIVDESNFRATVKAGIGFVKTDFDFVFALTNVDRPKHAELKGKGTGSGSQIDFGSIINLVEMGTSRTRLDWSADIQLLGPLAGMATRFMRGTATEMTNKLFAAIKNEVEVVGSAAPSALDRGRTP